MKPSLVDASVKKKGDAGDDQVLIQVGPDPDPDPDHAHFF